MSAAPTRDGEIETVIEDDGWRRALPDVEALALECQRKAAAIEPALAREIALLLCDDAAIQALNKRFRAKDAPTNVLSFPSDDEGGPLGEPLGDIALARETCMRQAEEKAIALRDHAAHLIIHGMLHLIGYDHIDDDDAARMEAREVEILDQMGIANPHGKDGVAAERTA